MTTAQFTAAQVAVNSVTATEILAAQAASTSVRLIATPKNQGQTIYIGPTSAVTAQNGYPLPTGEEWPGDGEQSFNVQTALYAIVSKGDGVVTVMQQFAD